MDREYEPEPSGHKFGCLCGHRVSLRKSSGRKFGCPCVHRVSLRKSSGRKFGCLCGHRISLRKSSGHKFACLCRHKVSFIEWSEHKLGFLCRHSAFFQKTKSKRYACCHAPCMVRVPKDENGNVHPTKPCRLMPVYVVVDMLCLSMPYLNSYAVSRLSIP
eukprot:1160110-Pelagomonas_calceolata.AAC.3